MRRASRTVKLGWVLWAAAVFATPCGWTAEESPLDAKLPVRGFCIAAPSGNRVGDFTRFIEEELAPRSVNALILRVDYGFQFTSRPEMADPNGLSKEQAQQIAAACRKHGIRIIPLVNLLGHQSWQSR
ncbi:MAG: hypothetical protein KIT22_18545, partial [Verrucomicrobiae bacterium]|nr:hypothetical protein [Verrucomicrobiae bacterium]